MQQLFSHLSVLNFPVASKRVPLTANCRCVIISNNSHSLSHDIVLYPLGRQVETNYTAENTECKRIRPSNPITPLMNNQQTKFLPSFHLSVYSENTWRVSAIRWKKRNLLKWWVLYGLNASKEFSRGIQYLWAVTWIYYATYCSIWSNLYLLRY